MENKELEWRLSGVGVESDWSGIRVELEWSWSGVEWD